MCMSTVVLTASPAVIASSPTTPRTGSCTIPDALQQFLDKIAEQCNAHTFTDFCSLKADLESRWRIACSQGHTSSTILYEILEYGWKEWQRITA